MLMLVVDSTFVVEDRMLEVGELVANHLNYLTGLIEKELV
jgi:hypothetical protein